MIERTGIKNLSETITQIDQEELLCQLIRLDSATNVSALPPAQRLTIALEADDLPVRRVAYNNFLSQHVVDRAIRDVVAISVFLSNKQINVNDVNVLRKIEDLANIDRKLTAMEETIQMPNVKKVLNKVPHVTALFQVYFRYGTVKPMLENLYVPYTQEQLRSVGRYLRTENADHSLNGLPSLAGRCTLAKWLYESDTGVDEKISNSASFVLTDDNSGLPDKMKVETGSMRSFLSGIIYEEYNSIKKDPFTQPEDLVMFPENYSGNFSEAARVYRSFAEINSCPSKLKEYAELVIRQTQWTERMKSVGFDNYSHNWMHGLNRAGLKFLVNTLISPGQQVEWSKLMLNTGVVLKEAKTQMLNNFNVV
jgi:hypothetical protein